MPDVLSLAAAAEEEGVLSEVAWVFIDVAIVIVAARLMGMLFRRIGQPAVLGEITAGILLGPTLLGAFPGDLDTVLFPVDTRSHLQILAQLGLILFMFIVGLEVDLSLVRGRGRIASVVSLSSVALPFTLGIALATLLHPLHDTVGGEQVSFWALALFMGVAMSITALPVLARILTERGMHRAPTGVLSLASAAIQDVLAWGLLAFVVSIAVGGSFTGVLSLLGQVGVFAALMFFVVRPLLAKVLLARYNTAGRLTPDLLAVVLVGVILCSFATEVIGVHAIFGAFMFGAIMPRHGAAAITADILKNVEQVAILLLLPMFFVVAGLQVDITGLGVSGLWQLGLILLVAIGGKFLGATIAARSQGVPRRQASALGVLMNTRGLTEIVILQVGAQLGVLDDQLFTMMVVMALVTTAMTGPLLKVVYPDRAIRNEIAAAERALLDKQDAFTVMVVVGDREVDTELVPLGCELLGTEEPATVVLSRLLPAQANLELGSGVPAGLAAMVEAGDELRDLSRLAEQRGVKVTISSHLSADQRADLVDQAHNLGANVVLVPNGWADSGDSPATLAAMGLSEHSAVAMVRLGERVDGQPVVVVGDTGTDTAAAVRLGLHLAAQRGVPLVVRGGDGWRAGRRATQAVDRLRAKGLPVEMATDEAPDSPLVLVASSSGVPGDIAEDATVISVTASQDELELDEMVAALGVGR